jgi:hypothetical protein
MVDFIEIMHPNPKVIDVMASLVNTVSSKAVLFKVARVVRLLLLQTLAFLIVGRKAEKQHCFDSTLKISAIKK